MKRKLLVFGLVILLAGGGFLFWRSRENQQTNDAEQANNQSTDSDTQTQSNAPGFDKNKYSTSEPNSLWTIVNKSRPLPSGYIPSDLIVPSVRLRLSSAEQQMKIRAVVKSDLEAMFAAASKDGVTLVFGSGYRSYALQKQFYDSYVARDGQAAADRYSARPGTSEHQTGLSFDATSLSQKCHLEICFEDTPEGKWLAANAHLYGFTLRYKQDKENVTGYQYEPWHFRYVGRELATELQKTNQTLEELFELFRPIL